MNHRTLSQNPRKSSEERAATPWWDTVVWMGDPIQNYVLQEQKALFLFVSSACTFFSFFQDSHKLLLPPML